LSVYPDNGDAVYFVIGENYLYDGNERTLFYREDYDGSNPSI